MNQFTPAQAKAIQTWTEQRDELLREIGAYSVQSGEKKKELIADGQALDDIHIQISEATGRLKEIDALEERKLNSVSNEVSELEIRKTRLETECTAKEAQIKIADERLAEKAAALSNFSGAHDKMRDQAEIVDKVVGKIIQKSEDHVSDANTRMVEVNKIMDAVIEKGNKNLEQVGVLMEKIPKFILALQRSVPFRRGHREEVIGTDESKMT